MHRRLIWLVGLILAGFSGLGAAATEAGMPQGLWQASTEARHAIEPRGADCAALPKTTATTSASPSGAEGIAVTPPTAPDQEPAWSWGLHLTGYGTPGATQPIAQGERHVQRRALEYRRGLLTEWYENRPAALEQGFTLHTAPAPNADELVLQLTIEGRLIGDRAGPTPRSFLTPSQECMCDGELCACDDKGTFGVEIPLHRILGDNRRRRCCVRVNATMRERTHPLGPKNRLSRLPESEPGTFYPFVYDAGGKRQDQTLESHTPSALQHPQRQMLSGMCQAAYPLPPTS